MSGIYSTSAAVAWRCRLGREAYVVCPLRDSAAPLTLAVVDDFGDLQPVPSVPMFDGAHAARPAAWEAVQ